MPQRQPRVGDIVDDYCPRERRVSDHAVVAMVGDDIRQTRCTTCDTEHEYREGKVPPARKKSTDALPPKPPAAMASIAAPKSPEPGADVDSDVPKAAPNPGATRPGPASGDAAGAPVGGAAPAHEGHVHRRLIRAVLPRIEGETPARQAPEFTMHRTNARPTTHGKPQRPGHGGQARHGGQGAAANQRHPGSRGAAGGSSTGSRGGPGGHGGPGGARQGRPHGGSPGQRKKH